MNALRLVLLTVPMALGALAGLFPQPAGRATVLREPQDEAPSKSIVVYVSDFDLDVAHPKEEKSPAEYADGAGSSAEEKRNSVQAGPPAK